jgi:hypothetical protein
MERQILKAMIEHAGLRDDFLCLTNISYIDQPRCGVACAPGCFIMSPAAT